MIFLNCIKSEITLPNFTFYQELQECIIIILIVNGLYETLIKERHVLFTIDKEKGYRFHPLSNKGLCERN